MAIQTNYEKKTGICLAVLKRIKWTEYVFIFQHDRSTSFVKRD